MEFSQRRNLYRRFAATGSLEAVADTLYSRGEKLEMTKRLKQDIHDEIYLAGERVRPGIYFQVDSDRRVRLDSEDTLPASLDGKVACYRRVAATWAELSKQAA